MTSNRLCSCLFKARTQELAWHERYTGTVTPRAAPQASLSGTVSPRTEDVVNRTLRSELNCPRARLFTGKVLGAHLSGFSAEGTLIHTTAVKNHRVLTANSYHDNVSLLTGNRCWLPLRLLRQTPTAFLASSLADLQG